MQDVYNALASKVYDVMQAYAEQHGYTLVLDVSAQATPVLYAAKATNITQDIIDAYNQKSGIPAPPPGAAGAGMDAPRPAQHTAPRPAATQSH
jgi:outer membrane protein